MCVGVPCLVVMACVSMHCLACFELCALEALLFARFSPTANIYCFLGLQKKKWARAREEEEQNYRPVPVGRRCGNSFMKSFWMGEE